MTTKDKIQVPKKQEEIPRKSDEVLESLFQYIRPVMRFSRSPCSWDSNTDGLGLDPKGNLLFYVDASLFSTFNRPIKATEPAEGLKELGKFTAYCGSGYHNIVYEGTSSDILSQIPEEHLGKVVAFEPLYNDFELTEGKLQATKIILYGRN